MEMNASRAYFESWTGRVGQETCDPLGNLIGPVCKGTGHKLSKPDELYGEPST